jgi:hypothetical protein
MKRFLPLFTIFLFIVMGTFAQAPKGINYQGVARDNEGTPYASKSIAVRISILKDAANGDVEYSETHKLQTNQFGLFTLVIGQGTKITGDFAFISWAVGNKWLQVEIDPNGGTSYSLAGSQQLMTVPYAFYAEYAGNGGSGTLTAGPGISITGGVISNTGDADNNTTNELQNLSDVLTRSNNAGAIKITNLGAPVVATDAATKGYVDAQNASQNLSGILTAGNDAGAKQIKNIAAPTDANDAATKNYVDAQNALDLDKDPTNELQNLSQVLSRGTDAGGNKIQNVGAPTANTDVTNKQYVDNAIATNYAFKVPYTFTNAGSSITNQVVNFGADIYDDFNVTTTSRFVTPTAGYYMFYIDGTVNSNNIILSVRVNNVDIYQAKKSEERIGLNVFINHHLNLMLKLAQGDFVELIITSPLAGDNVTGVLFGYKL